MLKQPFSDWGSYVGVTPKPDDFDVFWRRALDQVESLALDLEVVSADFRLPGGYGFQHLYFRGVGGARVHAKLVTPSPALATGMCVLLFHGYTWRSGDWSELLSWAACGATVLAMDCRGQAGLSYDIGGTSGSTLNGHIIRGLLDGPESLLFRSVILDCVQLARIARSLEGVDPNKVSAVGGSQGGGLALACAALANIRTTAVQYPFLCDYKGAWEAGAIEQSAYGEIHQFFRMYDPTHTREDEFWHRLGYIDIVHLCPRVHGRVLFAAAAKDTATPLRTQMAAFNVLQCQKTLLPYPDFGHEDLHGLFNTVLEFVFHD